MNTYERLSNRAAVIASTQFDNKIKVCTF